MSDTVKHNFVSRFANGVIMEADFSQLEVCGLAAITHDPQLIADLCAGLKLHYIGTSYLTGLTYEEVKTAYEAGDPKIKKTYKIAKGFRFARQYGSGPNTMAKQAGVDIALAKKFIKAEEERYPVVTEWQEATIAAVKASAVATDRRTAEGNPVLMGTYVSLTGRRYCFFTQDAPKFLQDKGVKSNFKPTEIKNYPVQGFATADIVPMVVGRLFRKITAHPLRDAMLLTNTVHDSVILDVDTDRISPYLVGRSVKATMDKANDLVKEIWGIEIPVPIITDVTYGPSWGDQRVTVK